MSAFIFLAVCAKYIQYTEINFGRMTNTDKQFLVVFHFKKYLALVQTSGNSQKENSPDSPTLFQPFIYFSVGRSKHFL